MAKNTGQNTRKGAVIGRSQTYNEKTKQYIKRDNTTGQFVSSKETPYKGVKKEENAKEKTKK
jgi:hypothetical protein